MLPRGFKNAEGRHRGFRTRASELDCQGTSAIWPVADGAAKVDCRKPVTQASYSMPLEREKAPAAETASATRVGRWKVRVRDLFISRHLHFFAILGNVAFCGRRAARVDCRKPGFTGFLMHAAGAGKGAGGGDRQRYQSWAMDAIFRLFTRCHPCHPFTLSPFVTLFALSAFCIIRD